MSYFLLQTFLSLLLYYACFVSIYISFIKNKQYDFLTIFFVLTLFLFSLFSIYRLSILSKTVYLSSYFRKGGAKRAGFIKKIFKQNKMFSAVVILSLISLLIGFFNVYNQYPRGIGNNSVLYQFSESLSQYPIEVSYRQQQPPLDYYFSSFSHSLFGESKFAIRFHAMFFYLILSFILSFGLYYLCSSFWITSIGSGLFLANHVIRLHSIEGRPLCLALFTGFLFSFFYLSFCKNSPQDKQSLFPVLASQYLFAMSIGLQPIIFIGSLFLSSFWLFYKHKKDIFKKLFLSNIVTGILVLPFYIKIGIVSKSAYKFKQLSMESMLSYIKSLDIFYFLERYFFSFYEQMSVFWLLIISSIFILLIKRGINALLVMISLSLILFPLLYDFIFRIGINWNLNNWYIITFSLILILFVVLSLQEIDSYLKTKKYKKFYIATLFSVFSWNIYLQSSAIKNETRFHYPYRDNSAERVYNYLEKRGESTDMAVEMSLTPVATSRLEDMSFRKMIFYDPDSHPALIKFHIEFTKIPPFFRERGDDIIYYIEEFNPLEKVFFIVSHNKEPEEDMAYFVLSSLLEGYEFGNYAVFELKFSSSNKEMEYIIFLSKIKNKTPKKYQASLLESLIYYAYKSENKKEFDRLLEEYKDIEMSLDEYVPGFEYPSRFELKRRVKYFKNLKWL